MLKASFKRVLYFLPYLVVYILVLCLMATGIVLYSRDIFYKHGAFVKFNVACYYSELQNNQYGLRFIESMDSFEQSVNFVPCDTPQAVVEMVENDEAVAGLLFPDGFIDSIMTGENLNVDVIYNDSSTIESYVINDLLSSLGRLLGVGQTCVSTMYEFCRIYDLDTSTVDTAQLKTLSFALSRFKLFEEVNADTITKYSMPQKLIASYSLYILMLTCFVLSFFYKGNRDSFVSRAKLSGISKLRLFFLEMLLSFGMLYLMAFLLEIVLILSPLKVSALALVGMIPVVFLISFIITLVCYLVKNEVTSGLICFLFFTIAMYLAGGLVPLEFCPRFIQEISIYNPFYYVIKLMLRVMFP